MIIVLFQMGEITAGKVDLKQVLLSRGILPREPKAKKPSRIGYKVENGKKVRVAKQTGAVID